MNTIKGAVIEVHGTTVSVLSGKERDYISSGLTRGGPCVRRQNRDELSFASIIQLS